MKGTELYKNFSDCRILKDSFHPVGYFQ